MRDGNRRDSVETPVAIEECLALGCEGVRGIVAASKRPIVAVPWVCVSAWTWLITLVPRTCAVRQELEAWGQQQPVLPLLVEKPGRTKDEAPRRWHGHSVLRRVEVEYNAGRVAQEELRFVVVHSSQLAQQCAGQTGPPCRGAEAVCSARQGASRWFRLGVADAAAAIAEYAGRGPGRRGRPCVDGGIMRSAIIAWAETRRRRPRRGRPVKTDPPQLSQGIASWSR